MNLSTQAKIYWLLYFGFRDLFNGGYIWLYDGTIPDSPDHDVRGELIGAVTRDGLYPNRSSNEFLRNALPFDFLTSNSVLYGTTKSQFTQEPLWKVHVVKPGVPRWFRFTSWNDLPTGHRSDRTRMDGLVGRELVILSHNLTLESEEVVDTFRVYL